MTRTHGRCARGQRLVAKAPFGRWRTLTFLAALRCDRLTAPCVIDGPINGESFRAYVEQVLVPARDCQENLVRGAGFPSGSDEALAEHDGELGISLGPFARRHFPLPSDLAQDEKDRFVAASSLGKWPLARTARRSLAFKASIAFVV